MAGFTRIPNDHVFNHPLWKSGKFTKAMAMAHLYNLALFKDGIVEKRGFIIHLKPGQIGYSMKTLASMWTWSIGKVRRFLDYLEKDGQIEVEKNNVSSTITLLNYVTNNSAQLSTNNSANGNQTETKREPINIEKIDKNRKEGKETGPILELHKYFTGKDDAQPNNTEIEIYRTALKTKFIDDWCPYTKERLRKQKNGENVPSAQFFFTTDYTKFERVHRDHINKKKARDLFCPKCEDDISVPSGTSSSICKQCGEQRVPRHEIPYL